MSHITAEEHSLSHVLLEPSTMHAAKLAHAAAAAAQTEDSSAWTSDAVHSHPIEYEGWQPMKTSMM